ncbi:MAG: hypothetical protein KGZ59_01310 [Chitinophagaceae bacterium]|nr:hypothetical protein [Chitinophagaceae bacterium]
MDSSYLFIASITIFILGSFYVWLRFFKQETKRELASDHTKQMQLQAYERLTVLCNRIALNNLISRLNVSDATARDMQMLLLQAIREEFDYNLSQQIYVSADAWNALKNLKDQNMLIINQIASSLPDHATGGDLNKIILDFLMNDKRGSLPELVSSVIADEAKKLM